MTSVAPSASTDLLQGRTTQLAAVLQRLSDGIILQDDAGHVVLINQAAVNIFGFANEAEARKVIESLLIEPRDRIADHLRAGISVLDSHGNPIAPVDWPFVSSHRDHPLADVELTLVNQLTSHRWTGRISGDRIAGDASGSGLVAITLRGVTQAEPPSQAVNRRFEVLHSAVAALLAGDKPLALLDQLYRRLADLLQVEFYFHFSNVGNKKLRLIAYRGISEAVASELRQLPFGESVYGKVAATRQPIVIDDVQNNNDSITSAIRRFGITAYVCHPLMARDKLLGTLSFGTKRRICFEAHEIELIASVCDQVAIAIERERASFQLRNSEERLRLALDAGRMGTFEWDLRSDAVRLDDVLYRTFDHQPGSITHVEQFWAVVHPDDRAMLEQVFNHQMNVLGSDFLEVEFRVVRRDGSLRWIAGRSRVTRDDAGQPLRINGVNFDITERREAEFSQRQSEARFRRLSDSGVIGIAFFGADGRVNDANDKFLSMIGYTRAQVKANRVRWDQLTPPEWVSRTQAAIKEFRDTGVVVPYEKEYYRRDGSKFWGLFGGARLGASGGAGISFVLDVTERRRAEDALKHSEERFQMAFDYAPIGMVLVHPSGRFLHVNRAYCSIVGYDADELLQPDFSFQRLTHPDDLGKNLDVLQRLVNGEMPSFFVEKRYIRKDGAIVWVRVSATVHRNAAGQAVEFIGLVEDITQRKHAEETLKEADRQKDNFLAALGHELRNPLAPIRNVMQILRMKGDRDAQVRWAADITERQVQQMTRLVDDLLDVSRINRGQLELRYEHVDLIDVIARSVEMTAPLVEARRHHLDLCVPSTPVIVNGDRVRLTQAVANLINNAAKYTPADGKIQVALDDDAGFGSIAIRDNGIGISPQALKDLFQPFRQLRTSRVHDQSGLGLGLALVKRLIELHGGTVEARSNGEGAGSEFRVRLPLVQTESRSITQQKIIDREKEANEGLRVVVVDDNRDVAETLAELLRALGHQADPVFSGKSALEVVQKIKPELVICDIGLPDLSGHDVAAQLRRDHETQAIRLVAVTGFGRDSNKALQAGFDEWLLKPVNVDSLESVLQRARHEIALHREQERREKH